MAIVEVEEVDNSLDAGFVVVFSEGDEGEDEGVLHFDLVEEDVLGTSFYVGVEEQGGRNRGEEEHVQEDKDQKEHLEPLREGERQQLVVRKGVVAASHVHDEDHVPQTPVVVGEGIVLCIRGHLDDRVAHQREYQHHHALEQHEHQKLLVG